MALYKNSSLDASWCKSLDCWSQVRGSIFELPFIYPDEFFRLDRLKQTAKELTESTGQECLPVRADVRQPALLKEAVEETLTKFGRIDFVICGQYLPSLKFKIGSWQILPRCCWQFPCPDCRPVRECLQDCHRN